MCRRGWSVRGPWLRFCKIAHWAFCIFINSIIQSQQLQDSCVIFGGDVFLIHCKFVSIVFIKLFILWIMQRSSKNIICWDIHSVSSFDIIVNVFFSMVNFRILDCLVIAYSSHLDPLNPKIKFKESNKSAYLTL